MSQAGKLERPHGMAARGTVITSLDPAAPLRHQLRGFDAWQALDLRVISVNRPDEAAALQAAGVAASCIHVMAAEGGPGQDPGALQVLRWMAGHSDGGPALLVRPDVFPALRSAGALAFWAGLAPALALTSEDCAVIEAHGFGDHQPNRQALDAFVLGAKAITDILDVLAGGAVVQALTLRSPGWPHLLAAAIRNYRVAGAIIDSGVLLRETPAAPPDLAPDLAAVLADILRLRGIAAPGPAEAERVVLRLVDEECITASDLRATARTLFFRAPVAARPAHPAANRIAHRLIVVAPWLCWTTSLPAIAALAQRELAVDPQGLGRAMRFFCANPDPHHRFSQVLVAILFCILCRQAPGAMIASPAPRPVAAKASPPLLPPMTARLDAATRFGQQIIGQARFDHKAHAGLERSCLCVQERVLLDQISLTWKAGADAAF